MLEIQAVIRKDLGGWEELAGKTSVEFSNEEGKVTHLGVAIGHDVSTQMLGKFKG